jgi:formate hydrogenlyase subunit 3/multisubunit Na+/H+ antiporter MnhD subunit
MNAVPALPVTLVVLPLLAAAVTLRSARWAPRLRLALPLIELALAAAALAAAWAGPPAAARIAPGAGGFGFLLDRLAALSMLLAALVAALAAAGGSGLDGPRRARAAALLHLMLGAAALASFAANLGVATLSFQLAAVAAMQVARGAAPRAAPAARLVALGTTVAFLAALACIYAAAGTFDSAALSRLAPAAGPPAALWLQAGAYLLIGAFTFAIFVQPLALGSQGGVGAAPPAGRIAALAPAALGAAAVMRLYTLEFPCFSAGPCGAAALALPTGLAVLAGAALAMLLARERRELASYLVLALFGMLWIAIGGWRVGTLAAGVYFLPQAVLAGAALILAGELRRRGPTRLFALALLLAACAPPSAGFVGVIAIFEASSPDALSVWTLIALSTLLATSALLAQRAAPEPPASGTAPRAAAIAALLALLALSAAARPAYDFALATARELLDRAAYATVGSGGAAGHTAATPAGLAPRSEEAT